MAINTDSRLKRTKINNLISLVFRLFIVYEERLILSPKKGIQGTS